MAAPEWPTARRPLVASAFWRACQAEGPAHTMGWLVVLTSMAAERSFIAIKPDGVQRGLVGEILGRFERKGFKLVGLKQLTPSRKLIGATKPLEAEPGTIRGDLAVNIGRNVIHGSDAPETAEFEIGLWFNAAELSDWTPADQVWRQES